MNFDEAINDKNCKKIYTPFGSYRIKRIYTKTPFGIVETLDFIPIKTKKV